MTEIMYYKHITEGESVNDGIFHHIFYYRSQAFGPIKDTRNENVSEREREPRRRDAHEVHRWSHLRRSIWDQEGPTEAVTPATGSSAPPSHPHFPPIHWHFSFADASFSVFVS